jgi:hypothetical protein
MVPNENHSRTAKKRARDEMDDPSDGEFAVVSFSVLFWLVLDGNLSKKARLGGENVDRVKLFKNIKAILATKDPK